MPPTSAAPVLRGVATDGHRLARVEVPLPKGAAEIPGVIVPRKTVGEVRKLLDESDGSVDIELSDTRIRFATGGVTLVSKLIDGTFPDYERVIPTGNDKVLNVPCKEFAHAVDRVSTISTEKSRAIKLAVAKGVVTLSATSPDAGSATKGSRSVQGRAARDGATRATSPITEQIAARARFLMADSAPHPGARRRRQARSTCSNADAGMTALPISALPPPTPPRRLIAAVRQLRLTDFRLRQLRLDCGHRPGAGRRQQVRQDQSPGGAVLPGAGPWASPGAARRISMVAPAR
jgi:hypothetical protein